MSSGIAGAGAGLGVAMPLGAIGVLLIQEGMHAWRAAAAAACAVATVDLAYATIATAMGPALMAALSEQAQAWVRLASAAILAVMAVHGLLSFHRQRSRHPTTAPSPQEPIKPVRGRMAFIRFAALTMINPLTGLYFAALATRHASHVDTLAAQGVFLGGVFAASLLWQFLLVTAGALVGTRFSDTARVWTYNVGYGIVGLYAVILAWPLPHIHAH
ncbi:LysE family transporter [Streptomyces sp. NPDC048419]|uniref:LysE family transporter n=1 Tax=Streptomyces sp. NPDC048419 TaxID=3365547 RepID=UPI00371297AF